MTETIILKTGLGEDAYVNVDKQPDACPVCHHKVLPIQVTAWMKDKRSERLQVVYRCPHHACLSFFMAVYYEHMHSAHKYLARTYPHSFVEPKHDEDIEKLSPRFVTVFNQAAQAEVLKLTEVAGMGYRKALEVLVKDFALHIRPEDDHDNIRKVFLGPCINNYLNEHQPLVDIASRAAWLGNDESHYERRWADKDITDLKLCLSVTVGWVVQILRTERLKTEMPHKK